MFNFKKYNHIKLLLVVVITVVTGFSAEAQPSLIKLKVVAELANIREKPDIGSEIIQQVPQGELLESTGKFGDWFEVQFKIEDGSIATGFVHESLVVSLSPPEKKETEPEKQPPEPPVTPPSPDIIPGIPEKSSPRMDICLSGGGCYLSGGDLNNGIKGLAGYYEDMLGLQSNKIPSSTHISYILGGELRFRIFSFLDWGVGIDYLRIDSESSLTLISENSQNYLTIRPGMEAVPFRIFIVPFLSSRIYGKAGIEYYFAKCSYSYRFQTSNFWQEWRGKSTAGALGFFGGLGYEYPLYENASLFLEIIGRRAKIQGFSGENIYSESTGFKYSEEGDLYIYKVQVENQDKHLLLFIRGQKPTEAGVSDARNATMDFSGISLRIGIKLGF